MVDMEGRGNMLLLFAKCYLLNAYCILVNVNCKLPHSKGTFCGQSCFLFRYDNYQGMKTEKNKNHTDEFVCIINAKCYLLNAIC